MLDESSGVAGPGTSIPGAEHPYVWFGIRQLCISGLRVGQEVRSTLFS